MISHQISILQKPQQETGRITPINSDMSQLLVTISIIAFFQGPLSFGIPIQPLWQTLPVWYLSNRSLALCHSNLCRARRMQVNPIDFLCCAGWDFVSLVLFLESVIQASIRLTPRSHKAGGYYVPSLAN